MEEEFNYNSAKQIQINDGFIKCVWLEYITEPYSSTPKDNEVSLYDGCGALIEFENGRKILITNSEWCSLKII
jgi:hypothetical protein